MHNNTKFHIEVWDKTCFNFQALALCLTQRNMYDKQMWMKMASHHC